MQNLIRKALTSFALAAIVAVPAHAQGKSEGKGNGKGKGKEKAVVAVTSRGEVAPVLKSANRSEKAEKVAKGPKAKRVTIPQAVSVTREVLVANGYQVTQVVPSGTTQVIYFRRGNRGNGRGLGPVEKIVVVPSGQVVQFQSVPEPLLTTILRRLGM
jgi:hypothetical protein